MEVGLDDAVLAQMVPERACQIKIAKPVALRLELLPADAFMVPDMVGPDQWCKATHSA